jgi:hypothetical protein
MTWSPPSTKGIGLNEPNKVLLYGHHGWGKTYQVRHFLKRYGKGFLLSGEAGLKSLSDVDVAYAPFTSFSGLHDPDNGVFSFRGLAKWISSPEFREEGYKWIALDSLTELSEMVYAWAAAEVEATASSTRSGKANGFALWDLYATKMIGTLKWFRDLDMHVYCSALASEVTDDNENRQYWPMVKGSKVATAIPAIFDHVFCAVRKDSAQGDDVVTKRLIVTEELAGWHGKVRDPYHRIKAVEEVQDITELLDRMARTPEEHDRMVRNLETVKATAKAVEEAQKKGKTE